MPDSQGRAAPTVSKPAKKLSRSSGSFSRTRRQSRLSGGADLPAGGVELHRAGGVDDADAAVGHLRLTITGGEYIAGYCYEALPCGVELLRSSLWPVTPGALDRMIGFSTMM